MKIRPEQSVSFLEESQKPIRLGTEQKLSDGDSPSEDKPPEGSEVEPEMLLQSDTGPISHEQLVVEVKGIYADLVMVEAKCIDIDERQSTAAQEKDLSKKVDLKNDEWQPVVALHKKLSHEHHDIFPASQHSSARSSFRQLNRAPKIKRGLPGFVNGSRTSALADTGAAQNVVSAAFVRERGLSINNNQSHFKVGNSKIVQSIGKTHFNVQIDQSSVIQVTF